ncbi:MAG TPA: proline--tRNA ligase [Solirubrobacterales bacterium]|nr:proline--tRNA ligase [Solirubrobacterales bacterium]
MKSFPQTRHASPNGTEQGVTSGYSLMERAGYVRPAGAAGVHSLLSLGWKAHRRICDAIYSAMEDAGVLNVQLPILQTRELWERTDRWSGYLSSKTMFVTTEHHSGVEFGLAPTAEEIVTAHVGAELRSWRELPLRLHQIGPKFRDELRPRQGLLRAREFQMSDAYSYDASEEEMRATFDLFREIYASIFERLGLENVLAVQADSGAIGGSGSAEYMVTSEAGEDTLLVCERCDYGANAEMADSRIDLATTDPAEPAPLRIEPTPGIATVEALERRFPEVPAARMLKTVIYADRSADPDENLLAICIRGDLAVNEVKLASALGATLEPASPAEIEQATGARVGYAGPIDLKGVARVLFDRSVKGMRNFLCGVNTSDTHALDANFGRDIPLPSRYVDVHLAQEGQGCPECGAPLVERKGIEVGHVFQLQREYTEKLKVTYTTPDGREEVPWMGCYGIGTTRLLQAIAEVTHDERGLCWPIAVTPYDVSVVSVGQQDATSAAVTRAAAQSLREAGLNVFVDDQPAGAGAKLKDADLVGFPARVVVGRRASEGIVEARGRKEQQEVEVEVGEVATAIENLLQGRS